MHFDLKLKKQLVVFDTETRKVAVKFVLNYASIISHFYGLSRGFCILIYEYQIFAQNMIKNASDGIGQFYQMVTKYLGA